MRRVIGRLRPMQPAGCTRDPAELGNAHESLDVMDVHGIRKADVMALNYALCTATIASQ